MKTKTHRKEVAAALTESVQPHVAGKQPSKAMTSTLDKLARQVVKQQRQDAKKADKAAAKAARQALTAQLLQALAPHLGSSAATESKPAKPLLKTVDRLAEQLLEQQRKQSGSTAKAAKGASAKATAPGKPTPTKASKPVATPRRPARSGIAASQSRPVTSPAAAAEVPAAT